MKIGNRATFIGSVISYGYDSFFRLDNISFKRSGGTAKEYLEKVNYREDDMINSIVYGDRKSTTTTFGYHPARNWLTSITTTQNSVTDPIMQHNYHHDRSGVIRMASKEPGENINYQHDELNQLTHVKYQTGASGTSIDPSTSGWNFIYSYDKNGNRTRFANDFSDMELIYNNNSSASSNPNRLDWMIVRNRGDKSNTTPFTAPVIHKVKYGYDTKGNQTLVEKYIGVNSSAIDDYNSGATVYEKHERTFNILNEMTTFKKSWQQGSIEKELTANYEYDEAGMRISKKVVKGNRREYIYDGPLVLCEREDKNNDGDFSDPGEGWSYHLYFGLNKVADIKSDVDVNGDETDSEEYFLTDQVGTVMKVLNDDSDVIHEYRYGAYGNLEYSKGSSDNRYVFTGKEWDSESGLFYFGARYYDPSIGRWISKDPMDQFFSEYSYCGNDPLHMVDPWGLNTDFGLEKTVNIQDGAYRDTDFCPKINAKDLGNSINELMNLPINVIVSNNTSSSENSVLQRTKNALWKGVLNIPTNTWATVQINMKIVSSALAPPGKYGKQNGLSSLILGLITKPDPTWEENVEAIPSFAILGLIGNLSKFTSRWMLDGNEGTLISGKINWPYCFGFAGKIRSGFLEPGFRIDRFGYPSGRFASPIFTPAAQRSLSPGSTLTPYHAYEVLKPLPCKYGEIAPAFGLPGGGTQFMFKKSIEKLINQGYLKEL